MKNEIKAVLENMTATTPEPEDYTGEDGLLYLSLIHNFHVPLRGGGIFSFYVIGQAGT